jgi:hypothetical protein
LKLVTQGVGVADQCDCGEESKIGALIILSCKSCKKQLDRIEIKKPVKATAIAALLAFGGSQTISYAVTDNRYPLAVEHEVMEACVSYYDKPVAKSVYGSRAKVCLCALEDTMNQISYVRYNVNESGFLSAFEGNAKACSKAQK